MTYFHTTTVDRGGEFVLDSGGFYEQIVDGVPQLSGLGDHTGFKQSQTPQVSASKSPEASLFAAAQNGSPATFYIYETDTEPDIDLCDTIVGDFALLEEVRYNHPGESPVQLQLCETIPIPERAIEDIDLAYLPPGANIIETWGRAVKNLLAETLLCGETYPEDAETVVGPSRPNSEAYRIDRRGAELKAFIDSEWSERTV